MASQASFDITSNVDLQEVDNAVNQAKKEVAQRYDFKGSRASVDLNRAENSITIAELYRLRFDPKATRDQLEHAEALEGLSEAWRSDFEQLLASRF